MTTSAEVSAERLDRRLAVGKRIFMIAAFAMFLFFLLSVLNAVLAGGRMGLRDSQRWDEIAAWPFIPLPAFLVIAAGLAALVGVIVAAVNMRVQTANQFIMMGAISLVLFGLLSVYFATIYTSTTGIPVDRDSYPDQGLGWHWIGGALQIVTIAVIAVRVITLARSDARAKRESDLDAAV